MLRLGYRELQFLNIRMLLPLTLRKLAVLQKTIVSVYYLDYL